MVSRGGARDVDDDCRALPEMTMLDGRRAVFDPSNKTGGGNDINFSGSGDDTGRLSDWLLSWVFVLMDVLATRALLRFWFLGGIAGRFDLKNSSSEPPAFSV